jgi:hypothetical protein
MGAEQFTRASIPRKRAVNFLKTKEHYMNKINWKNLGLIAVAVMLVGALAFAVVGDQVFADDGDDPMDTPEETPEDMPNFGGFGPGRNHPVRDRAKNFLRYGSEAMLNSVAEQTGIAVEELEAAIQDKVKIQDLLTEAGYSDSEIDEIMLNAQYAVVDQAVEEGKLTEEEGAAAKEKLAEFDTQREEWAANREAYHQIWVELIAEKSGIPVEDVEAALGYGGNVHQLLEEYMTEDEAHALIEEAWNEMIEQALSEGLITEEQAETLADHAPFNGDGVRDRVKGRMADGLEERFGENWQQEFKNRMNPDCDCTCPNDGDA